MTEEIWIADTSPLIVLAKVERLDLLLAKNRTLLIPEAVAVEILQGPHQDAARQALESGWCSKPVGCVEILKALRKAGLHLDDNVVRIALQKTTGEKWLT